MIVNPSLLITDDDKDFRETLRGAFEPQGFQTHLAADGEEAVRIVQEKEIHLLLMDMHMPRLSGLAALAEMRRISRQIPCILISAGLNDQIIAEAQAAHVFSILPKPVDFSVVRDSVTSALRMAYEWEAK